MPRRPRIHRLEGVLKHYPWGSRHVLAELQGRSAPSEQPEAELWLGAHPSGPAQVGADCGWAPLDALIREDPEYWLGPQTLARYGPRLPFLMKVLAVEQPLSLQVHPDAERAALVFEQDRHLPVAERRYADPYAKPELVCALTRFEALCGVRPRDEIECWLIGAGLGGLLAEAEEVSAAEGVRALVAAWLRAPAPQRAEQVARLVSAARRQAPRDQISRRILDLAEHWPADPGLLAPVLLHDVTLEPGEALFLPPGVLHSYLSGAAIEVMTASDNVVRAGLTKKPIHIAELLEVARFERHRPEVLRAQGLGPLRGSYRSPSREFRLTRVDHALQSEAPIPIAAPAIVLCITGRLHVAGHGPSLEIVRGQVAMIPAAAGMCQIRGSGEGVAVSSPAGSTLVP